MLRQPESGNREMSKLAMSGTGELSCAELDRVSGGDRTVVLKKLPGNTKPATLTLK